MNMNHSIAVAVFSSLMIGATPAWAQHGGGHGGGGHGGGSHGGVGGHAAAPVHSGGARGGVAIGHAVPRSAPRVRAPLHASGGRYYPSLHTNIGLGLVAGYPYYGYAYPYGYGYPFAHPYAYGGYAYGAYGYGYGYPSAIGAYGGVRIQGAPRDAQVYVDGYYAGIVDDFDGTFQRLTLEPGPHQIEIVVPGAPPVAFDVNAQPGRTITIRP